MEEKREDGLEWYPIYVSETASAVRYVLAEDPADAEDRFWDAYGEDGAFRDAVDTELQFTCSAEVCAEAGPPREGRPRRVAGHSLQMRLRDAPRRYRRQALEVRIAVRVSP